MGTSIEWSDLDLCVIKRTEKRFIERLEEVGLLTLPRVGCQILVYTPEEFEAVKQQVHYFFVDEILGKGKVLYERGKGLCLPTPELRSIHNRMGEEPWQR